MSMDFSRIRRVPVFAAVVLFTLKLLDGTGFSWGFYAHKLINRKAVEGLPNSIRPFFEAHQDFLSEHAIDPDLWRKNDPAEAPRHYIDIDMYGPYPFEALPRAYEKAVAKFGRKTVHDRGIGPWWVVQRLDALAGHMRAGRTDSILIVAAALGHYIADLHVPLHTTENYDGQLTSNKGIHSRFERYLVERYKDDIEVKVQPAKLVRKPLDAIFEVVLQSYRFNDDILQADTQSKRPGKKYDDRNDYDDAYYAELHRRVGHVAEARLSAAASAVASFWYTAWVRAGQPKLTPAKSP